MNFDDVGDVWTTAEGSVNGLPSFVRLRDKLQPVMQSGQLPHRLTISKQYVGNSFGLPAGEVGSQLSHIEELLVEQIEDAHVGLFVLVYTHNNVRTWTFYVDSPEVCDLAMAKIKFSDQLKMKVVADPNWSEYSAARGGLEAES